MRTITLSLVLALSAALAVPQLSAKPVKSKGHPLAEAQTLDLAQRLIALRSVQGEGNRTGDAMQLVKTALVAGGWQGSDVAITPLDDTAYLIATWPGNVINAP